MREAALNSVALETLRRPKKTTPGPWVFMTHGKKKNGSWGQLKSLKSAFARACRHANLSEAMLYRMEVVKNIVNDDPAIFAAPKWLSPQLLVRL
jgi:hypothetical protein